jgi:hypothetical protein
MLCSIDCIVELMKKLQRLCGNKETLFCGHNSKNIKFGAGHVQYVEKFR